MKEVSRRKVLRHAARGALAASSLGLLKSIRAGQNKEDDRGPLNVVIFHIDDLGWKDVSCYGSRYYETPHIDRLASEGMRFTNGYAACAVCSPTRAALMTGQYPARIGITDFIPVLSQKRIEYSRRGVQPTEYVGGPNHELLCPPNHFWLERERVTIPEALKPTGHVSCHVGKWHLGAEPWYPKKQGFDYNYGGCDLGQPPTYFDPYHRNKRFPNIPTLEPRKKGEYLTNREADEGVNFLRKHQDKPFFLHMAHYAVHTPLGAKKELIDKYRNKPQYGQKNAVYAAMLESVDNAVGRILETLDELGLANNTLVIFTGDNGGLSGVTNNDPLRHGKGWPYEGGIRVPLIIRYPRVTRPGTISDEPVTSVDYLPTILDAVGIPAPSERPIDGVSLVEHLKSGGRKPLDRQAIFWHFPHYRGRNIGPYSIIRAGKWKLLKWWEGPDFELYNLEEDIAEENDLSAQKPERVRRLREQLDHWLDSVGAKLPRKNPNYQG